MTKKLTNKEFWGKETFLSGVEFDNGICTGCIHFHSDGSTCQAFPKGIPSEVRRGEVDHHKSYKGDHGIQFDPVKKEKKEKE